MIVALKTRRGDIFYINTELVEAIYEREGNTSEILLTTGRRYDCIHSMDTVAAIINKAANSD